MNAEYRRDERGESKGAADVVGEALAKHRAMRGEPSPGRRVQPVLPTPKVKRGRKNRRKIPKE
jgi:hypothetical protein